MTDLLTRLESGSGSDRELDLAVATTLFPEAGPCTPLCPGDEPIFWHSPLYKQPCPAYTSSLDASLSLVERMLPGKEVEIVIAPAGTKCTIFVEVAPGAWDGHKGRNKTPARAACAALLRALTVSGAIGIDCGGTVVVLPPREWQRATLTSPAPAGGEAMLKPCPFCGEQPTSKWYGASGEDDDSGYWGIECSGRDCRHAFAHEDSEAEAVAAWNKRAPVTPSPASGDVAGVVERLRAFAGDYVESSEIARLIAEAATLIESLSAGKALLLEMNGNLSAVASTCAEALKPFGSGPLPSSKRTEIAFDRHGLRRLMSPLEIARLNAERALTPKEKA